MSTHKAETWFALAVLVIGIDQITKTWVTLAFSQGEGQAISSFFNIVFVLNRGAAFSFLANAGGWQKWFFIILALAVSLWLIATIRRHAQERLFAMSLALVLGGALGNVIDRLIYGAVVDFLDFHIAGWHWPAFNFADSSICIGVALLLWLQFFPESVEDEDEEEDA